MIWELRNAQIDDFAPLVAANQNFSENDMFETDGEPKIWEMPPAVMPFVEKRKKKQKPVADIAHFVHGALVFNSKSALALQDFILRFGQLLPMDCLGEMVYFYNVTRVLNAIDFEKSTKIHGTPVIDVPCFDLERIPKEPIIFKDHGNQCSFIYTNDAGRDALEKVIFKEKLTGLKFSTPGEKPY